MNSAGTPPPVAATGSRAALWLIPLGSFLGPFLGSSVTVALPAIGADTGMNTVMLGYFTTAYFLAAAIFMLPVSRLGDDRGRVPVYAAGQALLGVSAALILLTDTPAALLALRFVQGIGGAMIFGTGAAILGSAFPAAQRGRVIGINITATYVGLTSGPFLGGLMTHHLGWESLFMAGALLGCANAAAVHLIVREAPATRLPGRFDWTGACLLGASMTCLVFGSGIITRAPGVALAAASMLLGAGFVVWQRRAAAPLLDPALFTRGNGLSQAAGAGLLAYTGTFGIGLLLSLYLQSAMGFDAAQTGLVLVSQPLTQTLLAGLAGRLSDHWSPRWLTTAGLLLCGLGTAALALTPLHGDARLVTAVLALVGAGFALFAAPNANAALGAVAAPQFGIVTGLLQLTRLIGQMLSMSLVLVLISLQPAAAVVSARTVALSCAAFALLCLAAAWTSAQRPARGAAAG